MRMYKKKSPRSTGGIIYMDGLVSTGNKFPYTILKRILFNQKNFPNYFINILILIVDKPVYIQHSSYCYCIFFSIQIAMKSFFKKKSIE